MSEATGPGTLKCIVVYSPTRPLGAAVEDALRARLRDGDRTRLSGGALIVYTEASPDAIRDWIAPSLRDGESVFVIEFERWSSHGAGIDAAWLARRGH